ncbi:uncharacterized protein [Dermacentor andersoni]|uniref:uncharacterized protein n=1 Tax=Dermacentor andersoni TaxID=34620 RepID=UPI003B3B9462
MLPANIDNELLIAIVEARPILWQTKHKEHKNRVKKNVLWIEVAAIVLPGVPNAGKISAFELHAFQLSEMCLNVYESDATTMCPGQLRFMVARCGVAKLTGVMIFAENIVQTRWKSLRDKFRRLLMAMKKEQKSGAGAEETDATEHVAWPYFELLMFLKDSVEGRPTSGNMKTAEQLLLDISSQGSCSDIDAVSVTSECTQDVPLTPASGTAEDTISDESTPNEPTCAPIQPQQKKKRNRDMYEKELQNVANQLNNYKPRDMDEHFALALLEHMRTVRPENKIDLQLKLLQVVKEFKD